MEQSSMAETSSGTGSGSGQEYTTGVRLIVLNLPEDEGEGLGFRLTRTLWDPYPWVREVTLGARADIAGLKTGDCVLQADGKDLLGLPVGQVARLIRGDGARRGVSLLVWNCGVDPKDDPELLWSCGGGSRGEKSRRALAGVVRALSCCVCASTATKALNCARSHIYCEACWCRLERCALCREKLPSKESPYARNLVAEQVFEAIATEYEIKTTVKRPTETVSAQPSPNRSPSTSPSSTRKGQYQLSMMNRKKTVQFSEKYRPAHASDPNIHRSSNNQEFTRRPPIIQNPTSLLLRTNSANGKKCCCQNNKQNKVTESQNLAEIPKINVEDADKIQKDGTSSSSCQNLSMQHKLVARLRQACSLVDLQGSAAQTCPISRSLNSLGDHCITHGLHSSSVDNLKYQCNASSDPPVFLLSAPPIYVVTCDHNKSE